MKLIKLFGLCVIASLALSQSALATIPGTPNKTTTSLPMITVMSARMHPEAKTPKAKSLKSRKHPRKHAAKMKSPSTESSSKAPKAKMKGKGN